MRLLAAAHRSRSEPGHASSRQKCGPSSTLTASFAIKRGPGGPQASTTTVGVMAGVPLVDLEDPQRPERSNSLDGFELGIPMSSGLWPTTPDLPSVLEAFSMVQTCISLRLREDWRI